ncbi:hypothetical protein CBL_20168 [Carabus blaptoides fortunei]
MEHVDALSRNPSSTEIAPDWILAALDMKKTLARIFTTEKFGSLANERTDDIDFNEELNVCTRKVVEIQTIAESVDSIESNDGKKFFAKLSHVLGDSRELRQRQTISMPLLKNYKMN